MHFEKENPDKFKTTRKAPHLFSDYKGIEVKSYDFKRIYLLKHT